MCWSNVLESVHVIPQISSRSRSRDTMRPRSTINASINVTYVMTGIFRDEDNDFAPG